MIPRFRSIVTCVVMLLSLFPYSSMVAAQEPRILFADEDDPNFAEVVIGNIATARYQKVSGFTDAHGQIINDIQHLIREPTNAVFKDNPVPGDDELKEATELRNKLAKEFLPKLRKAIGETAYVNSILHANREALQNELGFDGIEGDPSYLTARILKNEMALTAAQQKLIGMDVNAHVESVKKRLGELLEELNRDFQSRYRDLLAELTDEQQAEFKDLFGQPFLWEGILNDREDWWSKDVLKAAAYYRRAESITETRGDPRISGGVHEDVDYLWYALARNPQIWEELDLDDDQREDFEEYLKQAGKFLTMTKETSDIRLDGMFNEIYLIPKRVEEFLLKHQIKRLSQLEFQLRVSDHYSTLGLTHPKVKAELKLHEATVKKLTEIGAEYDKERDKKIQEFDLWRSKEKQETVDRLRQLLTMQQFDFYQLNVNPVYYVEKEGIDEKRQRDEKRNKQK